MTNKTLIKNINRWEAEIKNHGKLGLNRAIKIGEALVHIKSQLQHGSYQKFILEHFSFSARTALIYVNIFQYRTSLDMAESISQAQDMIGATNEDIQKDGYFAIDNKDEDDSLGFKTVTPERAKKYSTDKKKKHMDYLIDNHDGFKELCSIVNEYIGDMEEEKSSIFKELAKYCRVRAQEVA